tara:strand:+ start:840 stop:1046 length:207 start_codon:yes stop_codon:yes gene_type:complete
VIQIFVFGFFYFFRWSRLINAFATTKSTRKENRQAGDQAEKEQVVRCRDGATEEANRKNNTGEEHRSL